jgi:hypothetical protein
MVTCLGCRHPVRLLPRAPPRHRPQTSPVEETSNARHCTGQGEGDGVERELSEGGGSAADSKSEGSNSTAPGALGDQCMKCGTDLPDTPEEIELARMLTPEPFLPAHDRDNYVGAVSSSRAQLASDSLRTPASIDRSDPQQAETERSEVGGATPTSGVGGGGSSAGAGTEGARSSRSGAQGEKKGGTEAEDQGRGERGEGRKVMVVDRLACDRNFEIREQFEPLAEEAQECSSSVRALSDLAGDSCGDGEEAWEMFLPQARKVELQATLRPRKIVRLPPLDCGVMSEYSEGSDSTEGRLRLEQHLLALNSKPETRTLNP